jgi:hypothetical protein
LLDAAIQAALRESACCLKFTRVKIFAIRGTQRQSDRPLAAHKKTSSPEPRKNHAR